MASILYKNELLAKRMAIGVDSARQIVANHWAEGRCGTISLNVTSSFENNAEEMRSISNEYDIEQPVANIANNMIFVTANHVSLAEFVRVPMDCGSIIRILNGGSKYDIVADKVVKISSEFAIHLKAYNLFATQKNPPLAIVHAYPMMLEHVMKRFQYNTAAFMDKVLEISPDQVWTFKRGISIVNQTDSNYSDQVAEQLSERKLVLVPHHGIFSAGMDSMAAFDKIAAANYLASFL